MDWILPTIMTGIATAIATTFDDNIYLTLFFSKVNRRFRPQNVVVGEFIGFSVLIGISLVGFLGGLLISHTWVGLLGFLPVAIGVNHLLSRESNDDTIQTTSISQPIADRALPRTRHKSLWQVLRDPQTYKVSAVTLANGGNNVAIYIPLFASSSLPRLSIILGICYAAIGLWCFLSYQFTRRPMLAFVMARYVRKAFPFVLIWIGSSIILENESHKLLYTLASPGL